MPRKAGRDVASPCDLRESVVYLERLVSVMQLKSSLPSISPHIADVRCNAARATRLEGHAEQHRDNVLRETCSSCEFFD